jgi:hypothetical protein
VFVSHKAHMIASMMIQNSRLHFIGTWRNRYQSLVGALARNKRPNNKLENPDIKATSIPTIIHIDMASACLFFCEWHQKDLFTSLSTRVELSQYEIRDVLLRSG